MYVWMDTDSAYFAMAGDFEKMIKPQLLSEFYSEYDKWLPPQYCDSHRALFIQTKVAGKHWEMSQNCCKASYKFHLRTPGLFKPEFSGLGIIALNSKTYFCFGENKTKMSTKGVMKKQNKFQKHQFLSVLKN